MSTVVTWMEANCVELVYFCMKDQFGRFGANAGWYTRHLHQRIDEHRFSAIGKHLKNDHGLYNFDDLANNFSVLKKCNGKLDCLIYEMLFIRKKKPSLNTQSDSIRAKLLV